VIRTPDSLRERAIAEYERQRREEEAAAAKRQAEHERRQEELARQRAERITALADRGVELLVEVMRERLQTEIDPDAVTFGPYDHVRESLDARATVDGLDFFVIVRASSDARTTVLHVSIPCAKCGTTVYAPAVFDLRSLGGALAVSELCADCRQQEPGSDRTPTPTRTPR
jgi:hypothetical protein